VFDEHYRLDDAIKKKPTADKLYFTRSNLLMRVLQSRSIADQSKVDKGQVQPPGPSSSGAMMTIPQTTVMTMTTPQQQQLHCNVGTQPADSIRPGELLFLSLSPPQECFSVWAWGCCVCAFVYVRKIGMRLQEGFQKKAQVYFVRACACLFE